MLVAVERLKIKEKIKQDKGVKSLTKEEWCKMKEEEAAEDTAPEDIEVEIDPVAVRKAEHFKEIGNKFFKAGDAVGAVPLYTQSLQHAPNNPIVLNNLAAAYSKLDKHSEAFNYANKALHFTDGTLVKAWFRRGVALMGLLDYDNAVLDFGYLFHVE